MSENKNYIGITIGPIFDMMSLVSTPAALWATSYMFSTVSKKTCEKLYEKSESFKIISPFFDDPRNELFNKRDGIGLFHDRIIAEALIDDPLKEIKEIKTKVLEEVSLAFGLAGDELEKRVLFIATKFETAEDENPILMGGKILDSLELPKKVMFSETSNPILEIFTGVSPEQEEQDEKKENKQKGKNEIIKEIAKDGLGIKPENWQMLFKPDGNKPRIKSLDSIARAVKKTDLKKYNYFAIVRSDGDNMSKIIERLKVYEPVKDDGTTPLTLTDFSRTCLEYCSKVAELVTQYKGVPVYSSGDDLLAVMPCASDKEQTIFDFVKKVNNEFITMFDKFIEMINTANKDKKEDEKIPVPSLSFGISICYKRFPLYEALEDSAHLLFDIAKDKKNCTAIRLQKHSGQSEGLLIYNDALDDYLKLQTAVLKKEEASDEVLLSALYKTEQFSNLFLEADTTDRIKNLFKNTFDAPIHEMNNFVHAELPEFYGKIRENKRFLALSDNELFEGDNNDIIVFNFAMRILKFFVEKTGKEGKSDE